MKNTNAIGTRCAPQVGSSAVSTAAWVGQSGWQVATLPTARCVGNGIFGGPVVYRTRFRSLINPNGIAMPVTHRMRASASEP